VGCLQLVPFSWIEKWGSHFLAFALFLLWLVFIPGMYRKVGGAARWLHIAGISFQPVEVAKLSLLLFLSKTLSIHTTIDKPAPTLARILLPLLLVGFPLMAQPDFGNCAILIASTFLFIFVSGISKKLLLYATGGVGLFACLAIFSSAYRTKRVLVFLNPWDHFQTGGFQIIQSYLGFQNGGLFGVGFGESRQKLFFLPEAHNDFILSVIGEESGFLGFSLVCLLFLYVIHCGFSIMRQQKLLFRKYLAFGITTTFAIQGVFNFFVVTGLLPTKGISLPLISSGVSSLLSSVIMIGLLLRLSKETEENKFG
jgi:cell division protein FtsW